MKKVIILGANGYIGSKFTEYLSKTNEYEITAFVQKDSFIGLIEKFNNVQVLEFTLDSIQTINNSELYNSDCLFNFAWAGVSTTYKNNYEIQIENLSYVKNILDFLLLHKIKKYIALGSASECVYGDKAINSNSLPAPCDAYSACKISAKYISEVFCKQNNILFNWVRISSVYGPGRNDNNIISYTIKSILNNEKTSYTKLEQFWDYIYIDDLLLGIEMIFKKGKPFISYPIGNGKSMPLNYYITMIKNLINPQFELGIGELNYKLGIPDNCYIDMTETYSDTGFVCKVSFDNGIVKTIKFLTDLGGTK